MREILDVVFILSKYSYVGNKQARILLDIEKMSPEYNRRIFPCENILNRIYF